jgi:hypothetical protein
MHSSCSDLLILVHASGVELLYRKLCLAVAEHWINIGQRTQQQWLARIPLPQRRSAAATYGACVAVVSAVLRAVCSTAAGYWHACAQLFGISMIILSECD